MAEFTRDPFAKRAKPSKDEDFYKDWGRAHWYCAACGGPGGWPGLTTHHIVKQGRAHEACNLLRMCRHPCHDLAEGLTVVGDDKWKRSPSGKRWKVAYSLPKITIGIALSLKLRCDPAEVDFARLQELRGSRLPDPEPIPIFFQRLFKQNRPDVIPGAYMCDDPQ